MPAIAIGIDDRNGWANYVCLQQMPVNDLMEKLKLQGEAMGPPWRKDHLKDHLLAPTGAEVAILRTN